MASTSNGNTPFFGSKISLISKSEIRYEGLLYAIDAKESTIALAKVKSFGSEDRIVERPVPPRDDIFQLIIFRASDIKDLIVDEPTPQSTGSALGDPAIVQAHASSTTSFPSSFPQPSSINQQSRGNKNEQQPVVGAGGDTKQKSAAAVLQGLNKQPKQPAQAQSSSQAAGGGRSTGAGANKQQQPQQPQLATNQQQQQRSEQRGNQNNARRNANQAAVSGAGDRGNREYQPRNNAAPGGGNAIFRSYNSVVGGGSGGGGGVRDSRPFSGGRPNMGYNNRGGMRNGFRGGMSGGYRQGNMPALKFADMPIPKSDFDFEEAQNEFTKLEEKMSQLKMNGNGAEEDGEADAEHAAADNEHKEEESTTYNKTKSFFDTISCEALEREKGPVQRPDWKNERKMNRETFGLISQPRPNYYNRGNNRYGGGGFRPNYRRPGGYQNRSSGTGIPLGGSGRPNYRYGGNQQNQQQPSSTSNGTVSSTTGSANKTSSKSNGVTSSTSSSSNVASSAAILAAVTGGAV